MNSGQEISANPLRVLVVLGHPRGKTSLNGGIARAFAEGAESVGCEVRQCDLSSLNFDADLTAATPKAQPLEPDLEGLRSDIEWADHLAWVYPTWWGTFPALLKGALDRVLTNGWAFEEVTGGTGYVGLLKGKTSELLTTMDTPGPVYSLIYRAPGKNALARATLGFCGIDCLGHTRFGPTRDSNEEQRSEMLAQARSRAELLKGGARSRRQQVLKRISLWIKAMRLQFYPMTFLAYVIGALIAVGENAVTVSTFVLGYATLFFVEVVTVFSNDLHDFESDRRNEHYSTFTGGSRVLVEGQLSSSELKAGAFVASALAVVAFVLLLCLVPNSLALLVVFGALAFLGLGYTVPPLKFCHRGIGEFVVALTHSFGAILAGHVAQQGELSLSLPWTVGIPLFFAVFCAITLADVPDAEADQLAGKRTLAVFFSPKFAMRIATVAVFFAIGSALSLNLLNLSEGMLAWLWGPAVLHGGWLIYLIEKRRETVNGTTRIDGILTAALSFIIWFGLIPLINLLR